MKSGRIISGVIVLSGVSTGKTPVFRACNRILTNTALIFFAAILTLQPLFLLRGQERTSEVQKRDLYYFVIDKSGSIKTSNLTNPIRGAVVDFVGKLPERTAVQLVFFNSTATKPQQWTSMDFTSKGAFSQYFHENFVPAGGTRLYDTAAEVFSRVAAEMGQYRQVHVIILSDGGDTDSKNYKSWAAIEQLMVQLKLKQKNTFFSWYSLGPEEIKDLPKQGIIDYRRVPEVRGLKLFVPAPLAEFSGSPQKVKVGEQVLFVLENEANITNATWSFGDSTTSWDMKPRHIYNREGAFDVQVIVSGEGGSVTNLQSRYIAVLRDPPLEAHFRWSPAIARVGEKLQFFDESTGGATKWLWSLNGGATVEQRSLEITPDRVGRAEIRLEVRRGDQKASITNLIDIVAQPPDARFSVEPLEPELGNVIKLKAKEVSKSYRHRWTVAETVLPSQGAEVEWKVNRPGRIEILHSVEGPGGLAEKDAAVYASDVLVAAFSWSPSSPHVGDTVSFRDESTGDPTKWIWEFQEIGNKTDRHPTAEFTKEGDVSIKLSIEKIGRKASSQSKTVKILPRIVKPDGSFAATPKIFTVGTKIQLAAAFDHPGWKHEWVVDKSVRLSGAKAEWTATRTGEIPIVHRVTTPNGSTDEKTETLLGKTDIPVAKFSVSPSSGRSPLNVTFKNESTGEIIAYEWDFGDGLKHAEKNPVHEYKLADNSKRTFTPKLTVKNRTGETSANTEQILITVTPPFPKWIIPAIIGACSVVFAFICWSRVRPLQLYGTLRWDYRGTPGRKPLSGLGKLVDLSDLGIEPLKNKKGAYILQNRKRNGMHVTQPGDEPILLVGKTKFELEGIQFVYSES